MAILTLSLTVPLPLELNVSIFLIMVLFFLMPWNRISQNLVIQFVVLLIMAYAAYTLYRRKDQDLHAERSLFSLRTA